MDGWVVCVEHQGKHGVLEGRCVLVGVDVPRPTRWVSHPIRCDQCGDDLDALRVGHGRVLLLTAGTEQRHYHPVDRASEQLSSVATGLEALHETLAAMLAERQRPRAPQPPPSQPPPSAPQPASPSRRVVE